MFNNSIKCISKINRTIPFKNKIIDRLDTKIIRWTIIITKVHRIIRIITSLIEIIMNNLIIKKEDKTIGRIILRITINRTIIIVIGNNGKVCPKIIQTKIPKMKETMEISNKIVIKISSILMDIEKDHIIKRI